jgi:hypothetical protein
MINERDGNRETIRKPDVGVYMDCVASYLVGSLTQRRCQWDTSEYIRRPSSTYIRMPGTFSAKAAHCVNVPGVNRRAAHSISGMCGAYSGNRHVSFSARSRLFSSSHYHHSWPNKPTNVSKAHQNDHQWHQQLEAYRHRTTFIDRLSARRCTHHSGTRVVSGRPKMFLKLLVSVRESMHLRPLVSGAVLSAQKQ